MKSENKKYDFEKKELTEIENEIQNLDASLNEIVSREYLNISSILRKTLADKNPCPVCGSVSHPYCEKKEVTNNSFEENSLAGNIANLHKEYESKKNARDELNKNCTISKNNILNIEQKINEITENKNAIIKKINAEIKDWSLTLSGEDCECSLLSITAALENFQSRYEAQKQILEQAKTDLIAVEKDLNSTDCESLNKNLEDESKKFEEIENKLNILMDKRKSFSAACIFCLISSI